MDRREFLKLGSFVPAYFYLSAAGLFSLPHFEPEINALGKIYKGTLDGKIYTSEDSGKTWQLQYKLGSANSILKFSAGADHRLNVLAMNNAHTFSLVLSSNGKAWLLEQKPVFS
jgi:hypothetical protein